MQRHEGDRVSLELIVLVVGFIAVAEGDIVEKPAECGGVVSSIIAFAVSSRGVDEFFQRRQAGFALHGVGVESLEFASVASAIDNGVQQLLNRDSFGKAA